MEVSPCSVQCAVLGAYACVLGDMVMGFFVVQFNLTHFKELRIRIYTEKLSQQAFVGTAR